jgi:hypothetical protein
MDEWRDAQTAQACIARMSGPTPRIAIIRFRL